MSHPIRSVAVVGAGTMGLGIAQVCAGAGYRTLLFDIKQEQTKAALHTIEKNLDVAIERGKLTGEAKSKTLDLIAQATTVSELKADLIIEAAVENLAIKQKLFADLEELNGQSTILASNTSSISISAIADHLKDKSRCIGLHFFNPADRMKLVEIISGKETNSALIPIMKDFCLRIGKIAVLAKDSPGFIVNRVARHFYVESLKILEEKVADVGGVDALLRASGFKMGPFELMDLIGVDTNLAVTTSIYEGFNKDPKFKPSHTQQQLVEAGHYGRKSGKGFYEYKGK